MESTIGAITVGSRWHDGMGTVVRVTSMNEDTDRVTCVVEEPSSSRGISKETSTYAFLKQYRRLP